MDYLASIGKTHIITTKVEHDSILNIVRKICKTQYLVPDLCIKNWFDAEYISPFYNSCVDSCQVIKAIQNSPRTGMVSVMHTNNETGLENDVRAIGDFCKQHGILFHTDCVQAAACSRLNVGDISCDFLSLSSHKIHGVKGVGALFVRNADTVSPLIYGGRSQEFGLRGGTENVAGIVGFGEACRILNEDIEKDVKYISVLRKMLYELIQEALDRHGLRDIMHINGDVDINRCGKILNLRFDGVDAETLLLTLDTRGVCVSVGSACRSHESEPSHVLVAMGIDDEDARNSVRVSLSRMNTAEDVVTGAQIIADCVAMLHHVSGS